MIDFYVLMIIFVLGWLATYGIGIHYLKTLRNTETNEKMKTNDITVLLTSIVFGSVITLFLYCLFPEIRDEDKVKHHRFMITSITLFIVHIIIIYLLFHFQVVKLDFM